MIQLLVICICCILLIVLGLYIIISLLFQVPFYPSQVKKLNELIEAEPELLNNKDFIDIGSGDGTVTLWASRNGAATSSGIEFNPFLTLLSKCKNILNPKRKTVNFVNGDFYKHDYKGYNVVYMYLFVEVMERLLPILKSEMNESTIIISNTFSAKSIQPYKTVGKFKLYRLSDYKVEKGKRN